METRSIGATRKRARAPGVVVLALLATFAAACGEGDGTMGDSLEGSGWEMISVWDGSALVGAHPTTIATVEFAGGKAFGSTGCNMYHFPYSVESDGISFGEPAQTGSACHPDYVDQGEAFIKAMSVSTGLSLTGDALELTDRAGIVQMVFRPASELPLAGVAWQLAWYGTGTAPLAGTQISLTFRTDGMLEGIAGCNRYSAGYQANDDALVIGSITHTEKACLDPDGVMTQEAGYLSALLSAAGFSTSLTGLDLLDSEGNAVAEYRFSGAIR